MGMTVGELFKIADNCLAEHPPGVDRETPVPSQQPDPRPGPGPEFRCWAEDARPIAIRTNPNHAAYDPLASKEDQMAAVRRMNSVKPYPGDER